MHKEVDRLKLHQSLDDRMDVTLEHPIKLNQPAQGADIVVHVMTKNILEKLGSVVTPMIRQFAGNAQHVVLALAVMEITHMRLGSAK